MSGICMFQVSVTGFQGSAPPLAAEAASLIEKKLRPYGVSYEDKKANIKYVVHDKETVVPGGTPNNILHPWTRTSYFTIFLNNY